MTTQLSLLQLALRALIVLTSVLLVVTIVTIIVAEETVPPGNVIAYNVRDDIIAPSEIVVLDIDRGLSYRPIDLLDSYSPVWSADGDSLYFINRNHIYQADADGRNAQKLTERAAFVNNLAISSNGRLLAYVSSGTDGLVTVNVMDLASGEITPLTNGDQPVNFPAWSPDDRIAFQQGTGRFATILIAQVDDKELLNQPEPLSDFRGLRWPTWSPDGTQIAYTSWGESINGPPGMPPGLYVMDVSSGDSVRISIDAEDARPDWTNDGSHLIYQSRINGRMALFITDVYGKETRQISISGVESSAPRVRPES